MKIKLGNNSIFEPSDRSVKLYILNTIIIILILYAFKYPLLAYIAFVGAETILLLWMETTYYPYGVKEEDMK